MFLIDISRFKRYKYHCSILLILGVVSIVIYNFVVIVSEYKSYFSLLTNKLMYLPFLMLCVGITFFQIERRHELEMYKILVNLMI